VDHFQKLKSRITWYIFSSFLLVNVLTIATWWVGITIGANVFILGGISIFIAVTLGGVLANNLSGYALEPLHAIWQAILHVSPGHSNVAAPNLDTIKVARELVTSLALQVYELASLEGNKRSVRSGDYTLQLAFIISNVPMPLFIFNKEQLVTRVSNEGLEFCELESAELLGKPLFESINLEFPSESTLEQWVIDCQKNKVTDHKYWERVRVRSRDGKLLKQCDIAAYYNRDNPGGAEFIIALFDRTKSYSQDDQAMSFVSLAVHELRTPLTMMRGYLEIFEEELADKFTPEQKDFMHKLHVSSQQLASFINNILNVARIDENQLALHLTETPWEETLRQAAEAMDLRAQMYGKTIEYEIAKNLPTVGVDRVAIAEVINNLLDNAIKYSGESKRIIIHTELNKEGLIETSVQDFGVGIPESVLPNLFEKFYRNHRTRASIGGTGLGLFLCKAIIDAHGGHIWAKSKESGGATFGFTILPFGKLTDELKAGGNTDIVRNAHGWIKNHSLYRR
jgi:nitrogen fixation/metabolism regulation signal transduction histidine kinase